MRSGGRRRLYPSTSPAKTRELVVQVRDDGAAGASTLLHIADRVGALGGSLEVGPHSLRAEIPCE